MARVFQDDARLRFGAETRDYERATKRIAQQNKSLVNSFNQLRNGAAAVAGAFGVFRLAQLTTQFVGVIAETERLKGALVTITGSAQNANLAFEKMLDFASKTPFTLDQSVSAFIKLRTLGIAPTEERLTAFGNTAAAFGKELSDFIEAVADASTNEFERLKEFGIKAKQQGDSVAFTFQGVTTTVKKNSEDIVNFLTNIGQTNFAGAMEQQMERLPGLISNTQDNFQKLFILLGESGGKDAAIATLTELNSLLDDVNAILKANQKESRGFFGRLVDGAVAASEAIFPTIALLQKGRELIREAGEDARKIIQDQRARADKDTISPGEFDMIRPPPPPPPDSGAGGSKTPKLTPEEDFAQAFDPQSDAKLEEQKNRQALFREIRQEHLDEIFASEEQFQELMGNLQTTAGRKTLNDLKKQFDQKKKIAAAEQDANLQLFTAGTNALIALGNSRNKTLATIAKAATIAQIIAETAAQIPIIQARTVAELGPVAGPPVAGKLTAAVLISKAIAVGTVAAEYAKLQTGGLVGGLPGLGDFYRAQLQAGEVVVPRQNFEDLRRGLVREAVANGEVEEGTSSDDAFGSRQEVDINIDLRGSASELIVAQRARDDALGLE